MYELLNLEEKLAETGIPAIDTLDLFALRANNLICARPTLLKAYKHRVKHLSNVEDIKLTIRAFERIEVLLKAQRIITESEIGEQKNGLVDLQALTNEQNVTDILGHVENKENLGETKTGDAGQRVMVDLQGYLSRPIQISTFQLPLATDLSLVLSVWDLFTLDPTVRSKLRNFAYLRGNLHVRVAVSGTPFHYGRLLLSYQPQPNRNAPLQHTVTNYALDSLHRPLLLNYLSQAPGAVTMDVRDNMPTEITCPFITSRPFFRLMNGSSVISDVTSFEDLAEAGDLYIYTMNQAGCVSATPSDISVYVYAWMTEVEFGTLTATQIAITTESDIQDHKDEREVGPVQRWATKAANFAGSMRNVPYIGPYAAASEMIGTTLGKVASIFGWSKPIMLAHPNYMKNMPYQNGAHVIGVDTNYKISLDPKQELTVDPRFLGIDHDELVITDISERESYLTTFSWNDDSIVMSDVLFKCGVSPQLYTYYKNLTTAFMQPTPMAFASQPFAYWRGTITFRFDIVCSAYHRGKFAVFYEPNVSQHGLIAANPKLNKQYLGIVDIQQTQSIEMCVNWAAPREWLKLELPYSASRYFYGSTFSIGTHDEYLNGFIYVVPITTLQSPDDSDISINVFVSCEDLEVNFLNGSFLPDQRLYTESLVIDKNVTCIDLNKSSASDVHIAEDYFGERPISFRSLLRRYVHSGFYNVGADANLIKTANVQFPIIPQIQAAYSNVGTTYDLNKNLFSYLRYAFVGCRGGIRKRLQLFGFDFDNPHNQAKVSLRGMESYASPSGSFTYIPEPASVNGTVTFMAHSNGGIEVELPFYGNNRYLYSFASDLIGDNANGEITEWVSNYEIQVDITGSSPAFVVSEESAAGEDFTFVRYQGAPYFTFVP